MLETILELFVENFMEEIKLLPIHDLKLRWCCEPPLSWQLFTTSPPRAYDSGFHSEAQWFISPCNSHFFLGSVSLVYTALKSNLIVSRIVQILLLDSWNIKECKNKDLRHLKPYNFFRLDYLS